LEKSEPLFTIKILIYRKYSFQTRIQFSQVNHVVDSPASSSHGFLLEDTCVSSSQPIGPFGANNADIPIESPKLEEVFPFNLTQFS
jgi:hypothetical protein